MPGYQNPWSALVRRYEGPGGELPGLLLKLDPIGFFDLCPFTVRARRDMIIGIVFTTCYCDFMLHLLLSALDSLFLTPSLSHFRCCF
jgi:hypothetical protein